LFPLPARICLAELLPELSLNADEIAVLFEPSMMDAAIAPSGVEPLLMAATACALFEPPSTSSPKALPTVLQV
jgi:hypothetical protein